MTAMPVHGRRKYVRVLAATAVVTAAALAAGAQSAGARPAAGGKEKGASAPELGDCARGELCLWEGADFHGERHTYELSNTDIESCVRLPKGATVSALANRTGRPVTLYQSAECAETAEFKTHPSGSWTPKAPYQGRAFKVWER
ncbi:hypothetical protein SCA03_28300 [Streptomyces cacaoi]|uniref:Peptidase inhibitor family I36 protein n=2 Tax=Streptomyces TaxID=1883 RepID=A0A4Y3QZ73_STRCI|nr:MULTISPECIES: peptidase inhibitor family I36 protein [Streptomyces]GEB50279.1 hypothetical protein SCA03_28300 [Streptomyces cacaoi]